MEKNKINKKRLIKLLESPGISGREDFVVKILQKEMVKYNFKIERDNIGSIWGVKKSSNPKAKNLMIDTHIDEVGFLVSGIDKNGLISFEEQGGVWNQSLNSQRLRVWNDDYKKSYSGVVLFPGTSSHKGIGKAPEIDKMLLDIGASSKKEVIKWGIKLGSSITFDTKTEINGQRVITKAADNRVGVSIIIDLMEFISKNEFDYNIIIGSSVQEEVGLRGARTSTYKFEPDLAIVIDVSPANDFSGEEEPYGVLGEGTMLRHKDTMTIYSKEVIDYLRKIIKKNKINYQDYFSKGGTNAGVIHLWKEGRQVIPTGIVARSLHTGSSVFDLNDYVETVNLIEFILNDLTNNKIVKFK